MQLITCICLVCVARNLGIYPSGVFGWAGRAARSLGWRIRWFPSSSTDRLGRLRPRGITIMCRWIGRGTGCGPLASRPIARAWPFAVIVNVYGDVKCSDILWFQLGQLWSLSVLCIGDCN